MSATPVPSLPAHAEPIGPVTESERIEIVDIVRGFALFGVLVVNFSHDLPWESLFGKLFPGPADRAAYFLLSLLMKGKFYMLFSFLFGWGFALQMSRAEKRGVHFVSFYSRRLFVLLLFGLVVAILGPWEVLIDYAFAGYFLFIFRRLPLKAVLIAACLCLCYWPAQDAIHAYRLARPRTAEATRQADARAQAERTAFYEEDLRLHAHGSSKDVVVRHARGWGRALSSVGFYLDIVGTVLPLFLLGLYVGRRGILHDVRGHLAFLRRVLWWGLGLGAFGTLVCWLIYPYYPGQPPVSGWADPMAGLAYAVGTPTLCFFYATGIVLLGQRPAWKLRMAPLAAFGRMALSNYLLQWLITVGLFYPYGLGLYGRVGPLLGLALAVPIFPLQVFVSTWWMNNFRFGPAEWLWRTLTYGKLQPMRVPRRAVPLTT